MGWKNFGFVNSSSIKYDCEGCENRHVGCHSDCEIYINKRREHDALNAIAAKDRDTWCASFDEKHSFIRAVKNKHTSDAFQRTMKTRTKNREKEGVLD